MDIEAEQLVYGSFPFRAGGYHLLALSAGCAPGLTAEVVATCRRFGQPPSSEAAQPGLFAVRLPSGAQAVVGVIPQGLDDRGRPGALAFHALIIAARDFRRAGANPFDFAPNLRADWSEATPAVLGPVRCRSEAISPPIPADPKVARIVAALVAGKRVALEATGPIDDLARAVWAGLPPRVRVRGSVATWAFANENRFDLAAFPRLAGMVLDASYIPPATLDDPAPASVPVAPQPQPQPRPAYRDIRDPGSVPVAWVGLVLVGLATVAWSYSRNWFQPRRLAAPARVEAPVEPKVAPPFTPDATARVQTDLEALATRFEAGDVGPANDPAQLLTRLNDAYHYHGRLLTAAEVEALGQDPDPDTIRALAWHERVSRFVPDPALPDDFASLTLPTQLAAIARSFHLDAGIPPEAVPAALIAAIARPGLIQPTPLAARFPALSDYARFLAKLPRSDDPIGSESGR